MVGQSLGAAKPERAEQSVALAAKCNTVVLATAGLVLAVFASSIARFFTHDPAIIPSAASALRIVACGFPFYAWGMVVVQALNGAGDTRTPTLLNVFVFWLWELPLAWVLVKVGFGATGIYTAIAIAFSTEAVAGWAVFRRGTWKTRRV
jgi:Na+-driven multidrug efflux pump